MPRNSPFGNLTSRFEKTQNRVLRRMDATGRIIRAAKHGVLAQLVRAPACHVGGREFKSRTSRHWNLENPPRAGFFLGYRTECVSAPIIHCRCSAGMWNSLQTIPEPYSSGALSFRLRLLEADANNPST